MPKKYYTKYFQIKESAIRGRFVIFSDDAPNELQALIHDIHADLFGLSVPNDWIYQQCYYAFDELMRDELENITIEADVYLYDLIKWLGEPYALELCNNVLEEHWHRDIMHVIGIAQKQAKTLIYEAVDHFLETSEET